MKTKIPFVDLASQNRGLEQEILCAVRESLRRADFILGGPVDRFERAFAQFIGVDHAVGTSSGLDALRLSLMALDVSMGHEVILPANTFIATALAVSSVGAKPVFVDCDPSTFNIQPALIEGVITPRTKAIIAVHLTGQSADMDPILEIAKQYRLDVIEDAAQAHGATYKERMCGALGTVGCFSFYPAKNLGACGDAGAVTVNDARVAQRLRLLRNYGQREKYDHTEKGLNARLDTLQASILEIKLRFLDQWNECRRRNAEIYRDGLKGVGDIVLQENPSYAKHIYHLFVISTQKRDDLRAHLAQAGIETGIHYPKPLHQQKAYLDLGYQDKSFPNAVRLSGEILSLPMYPELTREQVEEVCSQVRAFFGK